MSYKIIVDSCGELTDEMKASGLYETASLEIDVDIYHIIDDETFDQADFLKRVAACPTSPKSSCPSPERYMEGYHCDAQHVYAVTLSAELSGSYNSAILGKNLYHEKYGAKDICVIDSKSASCGETQIVYKIMELEEQGKSFEEVTGQVEQFVSGMNTYFVLENLDTLRKNGRLSGVKALVASTLNIKPVMGADDGSIIQLGQGIGMKKALTRMADTAVEEAVDPAARRLMITHCSNPRAAECVRRHIEEKLHFKETLILDTAGVSSMYANEGGVIVTI